MSRFKAIIFDLDGTLINSLDDLADSMNLVLTSHGLPSHPTASYRYFVGDGIDKLVSRALPPEMRQKQMIIDFTAEMRNIYSKCWHQRTKVYDGIEELLTRLTEIGIIITILTNKNQDLTDMVVGHFLEKWNFNIIMGARADLAKKPDSMGAKKIAARLKLDSDNILFIGDTRMDMETAKGAGMTSIGALWGFREAEELRASGADHLAAHPLDILKHC